MEQRDGIKVFHAETAAMWRKWLEEHHQSESAVWLIIYHKSSNTPSVYYDEAVDEALCYGWIDSKPNKRDKESFFQFFARRNPKSNWSRINKERVERLIREKKMSHAGLEMIRIARESGTWNALDEVEKLIMPDDLKALFSQYPKAYSHYERFPRSVKRGILEWILNAKRPETRSKRIRETVMLAEKNIRANQFRK
jgi:uncharacterized protein YdeI (YjbR/CyaY-like superfamily)